MQCLQARILWLSIARKQILKVPGLMPDVPLWHNQLPDLKVHQIPLRALRELRGSIFFNILVNALPQIRFQLRRNISFNQSRANLPLFLVVELLQEFDLLAFFHGNGNTIPVEDAVAKE